MTAILRNPNNNRGVRMNKCDPPRLIEEWRYRLVKNKKGFERKVETTLDTGKYSYKIVYKNIYFKRGTTFRIFYLGKIQKGLSCSIGKESYHFFVSKTKKEFLKDFYFLPKEPSRIITESGGIRTGAGWPTPLTTNDHGEE